ncbi:MAG TPA: hypothetical protein VGP63_06850 [Planctomycetaceae bacterium]|jgi:hypothetical protein|nr:hypothetical protein [Planctomycetaceae bacterium]
MSVRSGRRCVAILAIGFVLLLSAELLRADGVKLNGGGSLNGSVTTGSKAVSVRTSSGAVIVFDRTAVTQVTRGHAGAAKTGSNQTAPKAGAAKVEPKKRKLTTEEEACVPKVRALVSRLYSSDRAKVMQARNTLMNIDDTDAIPALSTHLGSNRNEEARHLYVVILHNMKGPKPVYYLVALSLFDESLQIRSEARKAIREDQLDSARLLYIAALRSAPPRLARIAAVGLGEIGDPRGDSIPFLINALVSYGTVATMTEPAQYAVLYTITVTATPGLNFAGLTFNVPNSGMTYDGQGRSPFYLTPTGQAEAQAALAKVTGPGQSLGIGGTAYVHGNFWVGGQFAQDFTPNSKGAPNLQYSETQNLTGRARTPVPTSPPEDVYSIPVIAEVVPAHEKKIRGKADHPEVLSALVKITDQKYPGHGFNQDRWRNWWAIEKINRGLQKPRTPDRVMPAGSAAH